MWWLLVGIGVLIGRKPRILISVFFGRWGRGRSYCHFFFFFWENIPLRSFLDMFNLILYFFLLFFGLHHRKRNNLVTDTALEFLEFFGGIGHVIQYFIFIVAVW